MAPELRWSRLGSETRNEGFPAVGAYVTAGKPSLLDVEPVFTHLSMTVVCRVMCPGFRCQSKLHSQQPEGPQIFARLIKTAAAE
jgi:hypothetical protein